MELKELLGEELYKQVQAKIDEKNSAETDKLKHVRYTDLSEGKYVSKEKYDSELEKLNGLITGKDTEIGNANKLIEELKKHLKAMKGCSRRFLLMKLKIQDCSRNLRKRELIQLLRLRYYLLM